MPEVLTSAVIPADAATTWLTVRDFNGLPAWHPAIAQSRLEGSEGQVRPDQVGAVRALTLADGAGVRESLVALDDRDRRLVYAILESPFPVRDYRSTIHVLPLTSTGESIVVWSLLFDCALEDAERLSAMFAGDVFETGLRGLGEYLSR